MSEFVSFAAALLALSWGFVYATFLWLTGPGRFLRLRRTWVSVVVGIGVDLLIGLLVVEIAAWLRLAAIVALSGVGIVGFALFANEYGEHRESLDELRGRKP